jgi:glucosamine-6-phosphate deaminase
VVIIITGAHKALALQKTIEGGVNHMWTLSSLQMHPYALIVVDEDATLELQVKTVKVRHLLSLCRRRSTDIHAQYFKSIEQVALSQGFGQDLPSAELTLKKRDSVLEKLDSPRSPTSKNFLAPQKPELTRSVTPDLVPDSMHERLPSPAEKMPLDGLEAKDVPLQAMHERVDSASAQA